DRSAFARRHRPEFVDVEGPTLETAPALAEQAWPPALDTHQRPNKQQGWRQDSQRPSRCCDVEHPFQRPSDRLDAVPGCFAGSPVAFVKRWRLKMKIVSMRSIGIHGARARGSHRPGCSRSGCTGNAVARFHENPSKRIGPHAVNGAMTINALLLSRVPPALQLSSIPLSWSKLVH